MVSGHDVGHDVCDNRPSLVTTGTKTAETQSKNRTENRTEQECIPVGCVPSAAVVVGGGGGGLVLIPMNFPLGCWPGPDPPEFPPWVWAWI